MRNGSERRLRYVIIGAGMAGVLAGIRLRERGETDFTIHEKGDSIGGTWRENRYPGLSCDVPAHAYTYSFAPNPEWSAFYAGGPEIKAYFERVAADHGLTPHIRFHSEVVSCQWDDADRCWTVGLATGETMTADVVIAASGVLHHPNIPELAGLDEFEGHAFHSARWDDAAAIDGARVGVIGNGSTGIQLVTALAKRSAAVVHFQRSPQWIMPSPDFAYSEEEREAFRRDPALIDAIRYGEQYWGSIRAFNKAITDTTSPEMAAIEATALDHLETSVSDPELREKLRPSYRAACKRLIHSGGYYDAVQKPNVTVERAGIERVEAGGVRLADGSFHPLDTLVLATGFHAHRFIRPTRVIGRGGIDLDAAWAARPKAYLAISIPEFPNFFMLNGPTGPVGNFSLIDIAELQWGYIDQLLDQLRADADAVSVTSETMEAFEQRRIAAARSTIFGSGCTSWYLDAEGVPSTWPWTYDDFAEATKVPALHEYDVRRSRAAEVEA